MSVLKMTQKLAIKAHLEKYGEITPLQAMDYFGCMRLAAIIHELRHEHGMDIETIDCETRSQFGYKVRYAKYKLAGDKLAG